MNIEKPHTDRVPFKWLKMIEARTQDIAVCKALEEARKEYPYSPLIEVLSVKRKDDNND